MIVTPRTPGVENLRITHEGQPLSNCVHVDTDKGLTHELLIDAATGRPYVTMTGLPMAIRVYRPGVTVQ